MQKKKAVSPHTSLYTQATSALSPWGYAGDQETPERITGTSKPMTPTKNVLAAKQFSLRLRKQSSFLKANLMF